MPAALFDELLRPAYFDAHLSRGRAAVQMKRLAIIGTSINRTDSFIAALRVGGVAGATWRTSRSRRRIGALFPKLTGAAPIPFLDPKLKS